MRLHRQFSRRQPTANLRTDTDVAGEIEERPAGYVGPNLDPTGLTLEPRELAPGVYALIADKLPRDNNGVIVGDEYALVVDAGINGAMARQVQEIAHRLTDQPIRFLANATYHGDHTFGNDAFPDKVTIISSVGNKASMRDLAREKRIRASLEKAVEASPLTEPYALPMRIPRAAQLNPLMRHLNRLNVFATYKALADGHRD
jgi:hypothetical protein